MLTTLVLLLAGVFVALFFVTKFIASKFASQDCRTTRVPMLVPVSSIGVRLTADPKVTLSIIVPMFNEVERLPIMVDDTLAYVRAELATDPLFRAEIVFVDDCSSDGTVALAKKIIASLPDRVTGSLVGVNPNRGKGYAVRQGVFASTGGLLLMADADGAAPMAECAKLRKVCKGIAIGSRAHLEEESVAQRTFFRTVLMHAFHQLVSFTFLFTTSQPARLRDTQCGFKLFTRAAALQVFSNARIERWAFDVELLIAARNFGIPVEEVPINWHEVGGSKLSWKGMLRTGLELVLICFALRFKFWKLISMFP